MIGLLIGCHDIIPLPPQQADASWRRRLAGVSGGVRVQPRASFPGKLA